MAQRGNLARRLDALAAKVGSDPLETYAPAEVSLPRGIGPDRQAEIDELVRDVTRQARALHRKGYDLSIYLHPDGRLFAVPDPMTDNCGWHKQIPRSAAWWRETHEARKHTTDLAIEATYQNYIRGAGRYAGRSDADIEAEIASMTPEEEAECRAIFKQHLREYLKEWKRDHGA